jgi:hypothetical protein
VRDTRALKLPIPIDGDHHEAERERRMTPAQVIGLNPTVFRQTLEHRIAELSGLLRSLSAELAILEGEVRLLRAGHKSALEVKHALLTWEISV